jgi:hypothetical protein
MGLLDVFKTGRTSAHQLHHPLVIAGYGIELSPRQPVGVTHLEDGSLIFGPLNVAEAKARGHGTIDNVLVRPGESPTGVFEKNTSGGLVTYSTNQRGTTQLVLGNGMDRFDTLIDGFVAADHPAHWTINAVDHALQWPADFTLRAHGQRQGRVAPYELAHRGAIEKLLILQGALTRAEVPAIDQLAAPGQAVTARGQVGGTCDTVMWIELGYQYEGVGWRQRHYYVPMGRDATYLITAQAPSDSALPMFIGANVVATSLQPRR